MHQALKEFVKNGQFPFSRTYLLSPQTAVLSDNVLPFRRQHMRNYLSDSEAILSFVNMLNSAFKDMSYLDDWMASPTRWTWVWGSSGSWWQTGKPGVLQSMGLQRVGYDWVTEMNYQSTGVFFPISLYFIPSAPFPCQSIQMGQKQKFCPNQKVIRNYY